MSWRERVKKMPQNNDNAETKLDLVTFKRFVSLFKARYSDRKMNDDTASLFFEKCGHISSDEFQHVTDLMIGKRDKAFTWFNVIEAHNSIFNNSENLTMEEINDWKNQAMAGDQSDRKLLVQLMNEIITKVGGGKINGDWRQDYAKKFVAVVGEAEARRQLPSLKEFDKVFGDTILSLLPVRSSF